MAAARVLGRAGRTVVVALVVVGALAALAAPAGAAAAVTGPVFRDANERNSLGVLHAVSLAGEFRQILVLACDGEQRVLWYAPGPQRDVLWLDVDLTGGDRPTYNEVSLSVGGTYEPRVGDFDGDGCEDVLWDANGGTDSIWRFRRDGSFVSTAISVTWRTSTGTVSGLRSAASVFGAASRFTVVGDLDADGRDDIVLDDSLTGFSGVRVALGTPDPGRFSLLVGPRQGGVSATAPIALAAQSDGDVLLWPSSGQIWSRFQAHGWSSRSSAPYLTVSSVPFALDRLDNRSTLQRVAGRLLDLDPLTGRAQIAAQRIEPGSDGVRFVPGELPAYARLSDGTGRSRLGALQVPGGAEALLDLGVAGRWERVAGLDGGAPAAPRRPLAISPFGGELATAGGVSGNELELVDRTGAVTPMSAGADGLRPDRGVDATCVLCSPVAIDAWGAHVAFTSSSTNLVPGDTNGRRDVFVWDRYARRYLRAPDVGPGRTPQMVRMSIDGSVVLLRWTAPGAPAQSGLMIWDLSTNRLTDAPGGASGQGVDPLAGLPEVSHLPSLGAVSASGRLVGFSARAALPGVAGSGAGRAYVADRQTGAIQFQPSGVGGAAPNGRSVPVAFSSDGTKVLLWTTATNLVAGTTRATRNAVVWDRTTGRYTGQPNGADGREPGAGGRPVAGTMPVALSEDGTKALLVSAAPNLVAGAQPSDRAARMATTTYIWDVTAGRYLRQPRSNDGVQSSAEVFAIGASIDMSTVLVGSYDAGLAPGWGATPGVWDAYLWDRDVQL